MSVPQHYEENKDAKKLSVRQHYKKNKDAKILCVLQRYEENKDAIKLSVRQHYQLNKDAKKLCVKQCYERNKDVKLVKRKLHYQQNKEITKIYRKNYYNRNRDKLACKVKLLYSSDREFAKVVLKRAKNTMPETEPVYVLAKGADIIWQSQRLVFKNSMCLQLRKLLHNKKVMKKVINYFKSQQEGAFEKMNKCSRTAAIAQVTAHRLIAKALQIRKQYVGLLLKTVVGE